VIVEDHATRTDPMAFICLLSNLTGLIHREEEQMATASVSQGRLFVVRLGLTEVHKAGDGRQPHDTLLISSGRAGVCPAFHKRFAVGSPEIVDINARRIE
jgi:hypothetical protein